MDIMIKLKMVNKLFHFFFKIKRLSNSIDECLEFNALTSHRPAQWMRKFDMNMF